ncbi:MAG: class I SAM-dependent methyltransferase [Desulfovibrionales bacterium]
MGEKNEPIAAGKSSYAIVDQNAVFQNLGFVPETVFLDLACGRGEYSLEAAKRIGPKGLVYAVDLWEAGIAALNQAMEERGITNIKSFVSDVGAKLPLADNTVDVCLMATVLHDLLEAGIARQALTEVVRVLKPGGRLAVLEFKKIVGRPGPPISIRLTPEETENHVAPYGFTPLKTVETGQYTYLTLFEFTGQP